MQSREMYGEWCDECSLIHRERVKLSKNQDLLKAKLMMVVVVAVGWLDKDYKKFQTQFVRNNQWLERKEHHNRTDPVECKRSVKEFHRLRRAVLAPVHLQAYGCACREWKGTAGCSCIELEIWACLPHPHTALPLCVRFWVFFIQRVSNMHGTWKEEQIKSEPCGTPPSTSPNKPAENSDSRSTGHELL